MTVVRDVSKLAKAKNLSRTLVSRKVKVISLQSHLKKYMCHLSEAKTVNRDAVVKCLCHVHLNTIMTQKPQSKIIHFR